MSKLDRIIIGLTAVFLLATVTTFLAKNLFHGDIVVETGRSVSAFATPALPSTGLETASIPPPSHTPGTSSEPSSFPSHQVTPLEKININTADSALLQTLPSIGTKRAEDIIRYREEHGPFQSIDDLTLVSGIGTGILEKVQDYICVE